MGTDIHMIVERWLPPYGYRFHEEVDLDRNYVLFHILAGVGGHVQGLSIIAPQRGLPRELDPESRIDDERVERLGDWGFSWFLLSELRAYNWKGRFSSRGVIPLRKEDDNTGFHTTYQNWDRKGEPVHATGVKMDKLCILETGEASNVLAMSNAEREAFAPGCEKFWVWVYWEHRVEEVCSQFVEWLKAYDGYDGHDYRVVFGFDT